LPRKQVFLQELAVFKKRIMSFNRFDGCEVVVGSKQEAAEKVFAQILAKLKELNFSNDDMFAVHLGLEEAFVNAVKYGNKSEPEKKVTVKYQIEPGKVILSIEDEGEGFMPESIPNPTVGDNIYKIGGRGLFLIRSFMDKVDFNEKGNCICMTKFNTNKPK
jgi:serine/threonine-protein kinase RsbW